MVRSHGRIASAAIFGAASCAVIAQLSAFVSPLRHSCSSTSQLRGRVALAATPADVVAAKKDFELQKWAATHLAGEAAKQGTAAAQQAAAAAQLRAERAEEVYLNVKAEADGETRPVAAVPAAPATVTAASPPVVPAVVASASNSDDIIAAEKNVALLLWAAKHLAKEASPQAAAAKARADQAVQALEALKEGLAGPAPPVPVAAAPAPVAASPPATPPSAAPTAEEVAEAKKAADLHMWAAKTLEGKGSLQAAVMKAKAEESLQRYEMLKAGLEQAKGVAAIR